MSQPPSVSHQRENFKCRSKMASDFRLTGITPHRIHIIGTFYTSLNASRRGASNGTILDGRGRSWSKSSKKWRSIFVEVVEVAEVVDRGWCHPTRRHLPITNTKKSGAFTVVLGVCRCVLTSMCNLDDLLWYEQV